MWQSLADPTNFTVSSNGQPLTMFVHYSRLHCMNTKINFDITLNCILWSSSFELYIYSSLTVIFVRLSDEHVVEAAQTRVKKPKKQFMLFVLTTWWKVVPPEGNGSMDWQEMDRWRTEGEARLGQQLTWASISLILVTVSNGNNDAIDSEKAKFLAWVQGNALLWAVEVILYRKAEARCRALIFY